MKRLRLAVVGFGRLGRAYLEAARAQIDLELAGVVRRPEQAVQALPPPCAQLRVAGHIADLGPVDCALVCVPAAVVVPVARDLLAHGVPIVECAAVDDATLRRNQETLHPVAVERRIPAMLGAGWAPGALSLIQNLFELLIPKGETEFTRRPAVSLHHSAAAAQVRGVRAALCAEQRASDGGMQRYVYVELERGADPQRVERGDRRRSAVPRRADAGLRRGQRGRPRAGRAWRRAVAPRRRRRGSCPATSSAPTSIPSGCEPNKKVAQARS